MKHISEHRNTIGALKSWSNGVQNMIVRYFFWNSGTPLQRSLNGLLRSLLHDIFSKSPKLALAILSEQFKSGISEEHLPSQFWTEGRLIDSWNCLITKT